MIKCKSADETTTDIYPSKNVESELENDGNDFFKPEDWEGKPKGHTFYDSEGNIKHECLICKAEFKQKPRLDNHISAMHEGNKPFVCYIRDGRKKFQCLTCKSEFNEKGSLDNHISSVHEGIKPHKCSLCDYTFSIKGNLKHHFESAYMCWPNPGGMKHYFT